MSRERDRRGNPRWGNRYTWATVPRPARKRPEGGARIRPAPASYVAMAGIDIRIKRVYEDPSADDGTRVLVDRIWPRGVSRDEAELDLWLRDVAPSDELRSWFDHEPERWDGFRQRYASELEGRKDEVGRLCELAAEGRLTLVYGARDEEHNNAQALQEHLERTCR